MYDDESHTGQCLLQQLCRYCTGSGCLRAQRGRRGWPPGYLDEEVTPTHKLRLLPGKASLVRDPAPKDCFLLILSKNGMQNIPIHSCRWPRHTRAWELRDFPRSQQQPQCLSLPPPSPAVPKPKQKNAGMMAHACPKGDEPGKTTSLRPACYTVEPCQKKRI